jgi:hypothetical protein
MNVSDVMMTMRVTAMNAAKAMSCTAVVLRIVIVEVKRKLPLVSTQHDGRAALIELFDRLMATPEEA